MIEFLVTCDSLVTEGGSRWKTGRFAAALDLHWAASDANDFEVEHQIYREDAVLEYPQSGERMRGRRPIQASRTAQPNQKRFAVRRILSTPTSGSPNSSSPTTARHPRGEHHGVQGWQGARTTAAAEQTRQAAAVRAGTVTRSMGRADALTERRSTSMASQTRFVEAKIPLINGSGAMPQPWALAR